jgi:hypothetical protein
VLNQYITNAAQKTSAGAATLQKFVSVSRPQRWPATAGKKIARGLGNLNVLVFDELATETGFETEGSPTDERRHSGDDLVFRPAGSA